MDDEQTPVVERTTSSADDTAAIRELVAAAERFQSDVDRFIALHTVDTMIVNIAGRRVLGRENLRRAMQQALDSPLAKVLTTTAIDDIRFLHRDVAIVSCTKHVSDQRESTSEENAGAALPSTGRLAYVVVRERDGWRIASAQTTPIKDA
ncbi:MAG TPA: SgcJ/EcaC family oxidoreductase [Ilumatobacteraceae bacterium]|nr:SgcJ/EcaC family oxidoreductase [Ilumatobacteraceae bacterium]